MNTNKSRIAILAIVLGLMSSRVEAVMCALDDVPAATLLLPYFEVTLSPPPGTGTTTLISINNASREATLAHVTLWTDWSIPTVSFDIYLTGYDVQTINLYDLFTFGNLPITADYASDPRDQISHQGRFSEDRTYPGCPGFFVLMANPVLQQAFLDFLGPAHSGRPYEVSGVERYFSKHYVNDVIPTARGYITVDSVSSCSLAFPSDPGYFLEQGLGIANDANNLWGDYYLVDLSAGTAIGDRLVQIEADSSFDSHATETSYTFYGRYTYPAGADHREPLGTVWGSRSIVGLGSSEVVVWRDPTSPDARSVGYLAGQKPDWVPLEENEVMAFDEQENAVELCLGANPCFEAATGRYSLSAGSIGNPFPFGWLHMNLNLPPWSPGLHLQFPAYSPFGSISQSFVSEVHTIGTLQAGMSSLQLGSACSLTSSEVDP